MVYDSKKKVHQTGRKYKRLLKKLALNIRVFTKVYQSATWIIQIVVWFTFSLNCFYYAHLD